MQIVMPAPVKGGLIFTAILAFIIGLIAAVVSMGEKSITGHYGILGDVLPEAVMVLAGLAFIFCITLLKTDGKISTLIDETLESIASGVIYFNEQGNLSRFNSVAGLLMPELFEDKTSPNYIGVYRRFLSFVYERSMDIRDQSKLSLDAMYLSGSKLLFREIIKLKSGKIALVQFYQRKHGDIISILTDISLLKSHIEEVAALTEENRIMLKAIEASGTSMIIAQDKGEGIYVTFVDPNFAKIVSRKSDDLVGGKFPAVLEEIFSDQCDAVKQALAKARRDGVVNNVSLKIQDETKGILWIYLHVIFYHDEKDRPFYVCFLTDNTDENETKVKLLQKERMECATKMASHIAHDVNNILSIVDGYSKIIRRNLDAGKNTIDLFDHIDQGVKRGSDLTSLLTAFGQGQGLQKKRFDIVTHVRGMEADLAALMGDNMNIVISAHDEAYYIMASPVSMTQLILKLAENSKDAMQEKGGDFILSISEANRTHAIELLGGTADGHICLQVIDNGIGMSPETLSCIYEPFFTTKDPALHAGTGMSLVYGLAKEIGAVIDIKSTLDKGTSISILIPMDKQQTSQNKTAGNLYD